MSRAQDRVAAYLQRNLDDHWTDAEANAEVLAEEISELDWAGRATAIDWFLWQLGTRMLSEAEAAAVIDRDRTGMRASAARARYVDVGQHTLAAVLMRLDEDPYHVADAQEAAVFAVSPLAVHRMALERWLAVTDPSKLAEALCGLPGTSFLAMAGSFDDTVTALCARDAFWRTMLGRNAGA